MPDAGQQRHWQASDPNWQASYLPSAHFEFVETILRSQGIEGHVLATGYFGEPDLITQIDLSLAHSIISDYARRTAASGNIYFCIFESRTRNAVAMYLPDDSFCIVITTSLIYYIFSVSGAFLSFPPLRKLFALKKNMHHFLFENRMAGGPVLENPPKTLRDEHVEAFGAIGLQSAILMATIYHELGHIVNGHLGLGHRPIKRIPESGEG